MKPAFRLAAVIGAAAMLGGCQSFPLTSWMFKGKRPAAETRVELAGNTAGALEEGKALLREGNLSAAVASFRVALLDPSGRAEASNGLGVAYAKLGRADLAERYFLGAASAEPENAKYVANLLRLQKQVMLARQAAPAVEVAAARPAQRPLVRLQAEPLVAGRVDRVSRGEVMVRARQDLGNAPAIAVAFRDAPAEDGNEVADLADSSSGYPARVALPE